jgi:putative pyruvate formate lyase activating enzyme
LVENIPGYIELYKSGELERRATALEARLAACDICPRACGKNRLAGQVGRCKAGARAIVANFCAHHGEEPAISGSRGSGTIFFGHCNLRCVYCQNHQISQDYTQRKTKEIDAPTLAGHMLYLQDEMGCHNINLVSPSHFVPQIVRAVAEAVPLGLHIPLVYNTASYDSLESLRALDGVVSIYLTDLRYASDRYARKYSHARNYVAHARAAIGEMYRQVGLLEVDEEGVATKGLIVRLLVLPNGVAGCDESLRWLAGELSPRVTVSVMSQYFPVHKAGEYRDIARKITQVEYEKVTATLEELGMENGWVQEMSAPESYRPDFAAEVPFTAPEGK